LRNFLELSCPLERRYRSFEKTGKPGFGDPSPAIRSGEIGAPTSRRGTFAIPDALVERIEASHAACIEACYSNCVPMRSAALEPALARRQA
jgi:hypothetical protein